MTHEEFKTIRRRLGYSQEALARVIGVKAQSVSRYEMHNSAQQRREISEILAQFMRLIQFLGRAETDRIMTVIDRQRH